MHRVDGRELFFRQIETSACVTNSEEKCPSPENSVQYRRRYERTEDVLSFFGWMQKNDGPIVGPVSTLVRNSIVRPRTHNA